MFILDDLVIGIVGAIVIEIVVAIAESLGVEDDLENEESLQDIGDKIIQAEEEGIFAESFDDFNDYRLAINNFEVDPEKSKEISTEDKMARAIKYLMQGIADKTGTSMESINDFTTGIDRNKDFFDEFKSGIIGEIGKNNDFISELGRFMTDEKIDYKSYDAMIDKLTDIIKQSHPDMSEIDANNKAIDLRK